jgi:hypothetical protein
LPKGLVMPVEVVAVAALEIVPMKAAADADPDTNANRAAPIGIVISVVGVSGRRISIGGRKIDWGGSTISLAWIGRGGGRARQTAGTIGACELAILRG